jgi:hypothetical protein
MIPGAQYRDESILLIEPILAAGQKLSGIPRDTRIGIASGIERGIYNRAIELEKKNGVVPSWAIPSFVPTYKMIRQMTCEKIFPIGSDPGLEAKLFDPAIWPMIAAMPIYELQPSEFKQSLNKITIRKNIEIEVKYSKTKCGNCGKYKVRYTSDQTRSADEGSTPGQICDNCNMFIRLSS